MARSPIQRVSCTLIPRCHIRMVYVDSRSLSTQPGLVTVSDKPEARRRRYMKRVIREKGVGTEYHPRKPLPEGAPSGLDVTPQADDPRGNLPVFKVDKKLKDEMEKLRKKPSRRGRPRGRKV